MFEEYKEVGIKRRKAYSKPEITRVELRADEAVLGACKNPSSTGPGSQNPCNAVAICNTSAS